MKDFSSLTIEKTGKTNWSKKRGLEAELDYAFQFKDEIVEARRPLDKKGDADFVLKGNVWVDVKDYNWDGAFFKTAHGIKAVRWRLAVQAERYRKLADGPVKFVFRDKVPDIIRKELEKRGIIVEVFN